MQIIPALNKTGPINNGFGTRTIKNQMNQYLIFKNLPYSNTVNVFDFWTAHSHDLPDFYNIVKSCFGLYPSSTCMERGFSMLDRQVLRKACNNRDDGIAHVRKTMTINEILPICCRREVAGGFEKREIAEKIVRRRWKW